MSTAAMKAIKDAHAWRRDLQGIVNGQQGEIRTLHAEIERLQAESNMLKAEVRVMHECNGTLEDICHRRIARVDQLKESNNELIAAHRRMKERAEKWRGRYNELLQSLPGNAQDDQMRMVVNTEEDRYRILQRRYNDAVAREADMDLINSLWALLQSQKRRLLMTRGGQQ